MTGLHRLVVSPLSHESPHPLVEQITRYVRARVDERVLRAGMRMPSIRRFAADNGVSRFTAVEAYDRLVAQGYLESRRGSGFYVKALAPAGPGAVNDAGERPGADAGSPVDLAWVLRSTFSTAPSAIMAGTGCLPAEWLDGELVGRGLRGMLAEAASEPGAIGLVYGTPEGFLPLRQQLQIVLAEHEIAAAPENIVLTAGASQALDLIARLLLSPGDTVLVDDPGYYVLYGRLAALGIRMAGVPRLGDGPDLARLASLAAELKPRLYFTQSVLHNPTGNSLSAAAAYSVLRLAEQHDFRIVEDDVYADLHPGKAHRIAALDQLRRVIHVGGFSKTLGAGLRVGYLACERGLAQALTDGKMLAALTTSELGERLCYRVLSGGQYRKHVERLRERLARAIDRTTANLERAGLTLFARPAGGMFVWARGPEKSDSNALAVRALEHGVVLVPGSLFSPAQLASPWMRFAVATANHPRVLKTLETLMAKA